MMIVMRASCGLDHRDRNAWLYSLAAPDLDMSVHAATMDSPNVRVMLTSNDRRQVLRVLESDFGGYLRARYGDRVTLTTGCTVLTSAKQTQLACIDMVIRERLGQEAA